MTRWIAIALLAGLVPSVALAQTPKPKTHLLIYKTEQAAERHCSKDTVVWASTSSHRLYLPGDPHFAHTKGGYACEAEAKKLGYHGPTAHS
jgi:hypothetical protein